jgi:hypothetical protein
VAVAVAGSGYIPAVSHKLAELMPKNVLTHFGGDLPLQQFTLSINVLAGIASLLLLAYALLPRKPKVYVLDFAVHAHDPRSVRLGWDTTSYSNRSHACMVS